MLVKTQGIVINYLKYKESSIIVKIFTRELGVQTYIVNGVRKKTKNNKINFFQVLTQLDLVVYSDDKKDIHRISEVNFSEKYKSINTDVVKSSIAFFIAEVLNKTLTHAEENESLFEYISGQLIKFDKNEIFTSNFHLNFLNSILPHLGYPTALIEEREKVLNSNQLDRITRNHLLQEILLYYNEQEIIHGKLKSLEVLNSVFS